jgi:hypothetical protein
MDVAAGHDQVGYSARELPIEFAPLWQIGYSVVASADRMAEDPYSAGGERRQTRDHL